jgi:hypothetical protein
MKELSERIAQLQGRSAVQKRHPLMAQQLICLRARKGKSLKNLQPVNNLQPMVYIGL